VNRKIAFSCTVIVLVIAYAIFGRAGRWSDANVAESKSRGNRIVTALEHYKLRHAKYPASLDLLRDEFVDTIQPPVAGPGVWEYRAFPDGQDFSLRFEGVAGIFSLAPVCWYQRPQGGWSIDTR
jgi:hypothetical protein